MNYNGVDLGGTLRPKHCEIRGGTSHLVLGSHFAARPAQHHAPPGTTGHRWAPPGTPPHVVAAPPPPPGGRSQEAPLAVAVNPKASSSIASHVVVHARARVSVCVFVCGRVCAPPRGCACAFFKNQSAEESLPRLRAGPAWPCLPPRLSPSRSSRHKTRAASTNGNQEGWANLRKAPK